MTRSHARAPKGKRAYAKVTTKRGKNVSLIGAISLNGLLTQVALLGSVNTLTFEAFIRQRLIPKLWKGACVVMDNCSIHHAIASNHNSCEDLAIAIQTLLDYKCSGHAAITISAIALQLARG